MFFIKNLIITLTLLSFYCDQSSAMQCMAKESINNFSKQKVWYKVSKRSFNNKSNQNIVNIDLEISKENINKTLETPIIRKSTPNSYVLPTDFFMEKRNNIILSSVNERVFHIHRNITMEKEIFVQDATNQEENRQDKQQALFKKKDGVVVDRRIKINDPLNPQYLPICYLHGSYKLSDKDSLFYTGSGFRNSINQIITAGHNLFIEEDDVEQYCERKKILLPQKKFSFDKKLLTMQIIFGYRDEAGIARYSYISEINGKHCFIYESRDLGIIQLPVSQKKLLDDDIGSLPIMFFPDQPHEYIEKYTTIVGYPGEIGKPSLYYHSGPIKNVDPGKVVFYDVDTTKGNSGSPGLNGIKNDKDIIIPVFLTHTHAVNKTTLNAGQGYDQDFYDFMYSKLSE
jgi:V8-like Glu-specific endopeptidase